MIVNNTPNTISNKYIVVRDTNNEFWYYGNYDSFTKAYEVAKQIGNGLVITKDELE